MFFSPQNMTTDKRKKEEAKHNKNEKYLIAITE